MRPGSEGTLGVIVSYAELGRLTVGARAGSTVCFLILLWAGRLASNALMAPCSVWSVGGP